MMIKSIIIELEKRVFASDIEDTQWIAATTIDNNKIIFWGNEALCANLLALEQHSLPLLVQCNQCEKVDTQCTYQEYPYFSVSESATLTIYPYQPEKINHLLEHGYRQNELVNRLMHS
ncbi:MAG: hypothetical protein HAW67_00410 [Endozoicomonadaceae bacterium]|nr:hypothetical protein [Endozoicomonadaceae bacterium]